MVNQDSASTDVPDKVFRTYLLDKPIYNCVMKDL